MTSAADVSWQTSTPLSDVAMRRKFLCLALLPLALASDAPACDATGDVSALKRRAAELFAGGDAAVADACLGAALAALTSQLEALAAEAESLQAYRQARRTAASAGTADGCVVDARGQSVCLQPPDGAALPVARAPPAALTHCGAESEALALLQRIERGEAAVAAEAVEDGIVHAAHRHWWSAARGAVNHLRASNVAIGSEARRAVTELRDEATAVLNLMRQTKMDEAVISCAVMWAQGESSVRATPAAARPQHPQCPELTRAAAARRST